MSRTSTLALVGILCCSAWCQAATQIDAGDHLLLPNTPHQRIDIYVTGDGDQIQAVNFNVEIGTDVNDYFHIPNFQFTSGAHFGSPGPNLSTLLAPGSIFSSVALIEDDVTFFPTLWQAGVTLPFPQTVAANGLLATLYIDTTGYTSGQWLLTLNTEGGTTNWANSRFPPGSDTFVENPVLIDGSITIVPEPSTLALGALAAVGLFSMGFRRRAVDR